MSVASLALVVACGGAGQPTSGATGDGRPDLALFLADGVTGDGGREGGETGAILDGLGIEPARVFDAAYAQNPTPFVSLASLLTGLAPSAVPVCGLGSRAGAAPAAVPWCARVPETRYTLPQVLAIYGYRSTFLHSAFPGADLVSHGFQDREAVDLDEGRTDWEALAGQVLAARTGPGPSLLVVNLADLDAFALIGAGETADGVPLPRALSGTRAGAAIERHVPFVVPRGEEAIADRTERLRAVAAGLGPILRAWLAPREGRQSYAVLSALHGNAEGGPYVDGRGTRHENVASDFVLERNVHVPLAMWGPVSWKTRRVSHPVELTDLFPTFASLAGAVPPAEATGSDLSRDPLPSHPLAWAYAEHGDMLGLRMERWFYSFRTYNHDTSLLDPMLTEDIAHSPAGDRQGSLHDVVADPMQMRPLDEADPERAESMRAALARVRKTESARAADQMTAERIWELRMSANQGYW